METPLAAAAAVAAVALAWAYLIHRRQRGARAKGTILETAGERDARLKEALRPLEKGLTVYFAGESPCARRVLWALREKGLEYKSCVVSLVHGEQRHPAFLALNPQGKVPILVCRGLKHVADVTIFESNAILLFLDEAFPETTPVLPTAPDQRLEARLWNYWELAMAEEIWPLSRMQVDGVLWRFAHSRSEWDKAKKLMGSGDPFYTAKISNIAAGTYLSPAQMRRCQIGTARGFAMLEHALSDGREFLVGGTFSVADISVTPRLLKAPINGLVATPAQRAEHPHCIRFFERMRARKALAPFRRGDDATWGSGSGCYVLSLAGFGPAWLDGIPWWLITLIGNLRHGTYSFKRCNASSAPKRSDPVVLASLLRGIPDRTAVPPPAPPAGQAQAGRPGWQLYADPALPLCAAVRIVLETISSAPSDGAVAPPTPATTLVPVDNALCENFSRKVLALMPFGELPVMVGANGAVCYGPTNIAEYAIEEALALAGNAGSGKPWAAMMPSDPVLRATCRKWAGWARTGFHYQLHPLYWRDVAGPRLRRQFGDDEAGLRAALAASLGDGGSSRVPIDCIHAIDAYAHASETPGAALRGVYGEASEAELVERLWYVDAALAEHHADGPPADATQQAFLCGPGAPTIADAFAAPLCAVALARYHYALGGKSAPARVTAWLGALRAYSPAFDETLAALVEAWGVNVTALKGLHAWM